MKITTKIIVLVSFCLNVIYGELTESSSEEIEPVMIIEIYKPGSTTPIYGNPINRDYIKERGNKALTEFGMRQHLNLGVDTRRAYQKLFESIEHPRDVRVYSSSSRASAMSAMSHNVGLFRNVGRKHIELEFKNRHVTPLWLNGQVQNKTKLTSFETE